MFGYCRAGTADILGTACGSDTDCAPRCSGYVCVAGRCAGPDASVPSDLGRSTDVSSLSEDVQSTRADAGTDAFDVISVEARDVVMEDRVTVVRDVIAADRVTIARDVVAEDRGAFAEDRGASDAGAFSDVGRDPEGGQGCAARPRSRGGGASAACGVLLVAGLLRRRRTGRAAIAESDFDVGQARATLTRASAAAAKAPL